jgi:hypothetical protein
MNSKNNGNLGKIVYLDWVEVIALRKALNSTIEGSKLGLSFLDPGDLSDDWFKDLQSFQKLFVELSKEMENESD